MKNYKKIILCVLTTLLVGSSQIQHVAAATMQDGASVNSVSETVQRRASSAVVNISKGGTNVTITFNYSDGTSVDFAGVSYNSKKYNIAITQNSFSGDSRRVQIVLTNKNDGSKITLGAWCNVYGETGTF